MKFIRIAVIFLLMFTLQFFIGCKKSADNPFSEPYQRMMKENALIEAAFDDVLKISENIMMNNGDAKIATAGSPLGCITSIDSVVTGVNQKKYTVTFYDSCTSYDGKWRSGKIIFVLDGVNYNTSGAKLTVTFENFKFNFNSLYGKMIVTNEGGGIFNVQVNDITGLGYASLEIYETGNRIVNWRTIHKRVIAKGNGDNIIINNDYFILTPGNCFMEGITSNDDYYTASVGSPIQLDYSCIAVGELRYPISGTLNFVMNSNNYRTVNYSGDTIACDRIVNMIFDSQTSVLYDLY